MSSSSSSFEPSWELSAHNYKPSSQHELQAARRNHAQGAKLLDGQFERPFQSGATRRVAKGVYTAGPRRGQPCVIKWPLSGHTYRRHRFDLDLAIVDRALEIITQFNAARVIAEPIRLNVPDVWNIDNYKVLIEPYIENMKKWNSNSGWFLGGGGWTRVMQALSHFSYHITEGQELLCDVQGGIYENCAVLTDPVICSREERYGSTDLGRRGIQKFFENHKCNEYCRAYWKRPITKRGSAPHMVYPGTVRKTSR